MPHSSSSFHNIMIAFNRLIFENKRINRQGCSLGRRVLWARSNISHLCPLWSTTTFHTLPDPRVYCTEQHYMKQGTSLVIQQLRLNAPSAGGPGSIPGQGARSHMLQLKILSAATNSQHSQIKKPKSKQNAIRDKLFLKTQSFKSIKK